MHVFINDDVTLIHDQRVATHFHSEQHLRTAINALAEKYGCNTDEYEIDNIDVGAHKIIKAIMRNDPVIREDNVFGVGIENFICRDYQRECDFGEANKLLGLHMFDTGMAFYGFIAGGDGQRSVYMILYHDGKKLRLYTPHWGNKLNLNRQEPLMNDDRSDRYMARYGVDRSTLGFNWNTIKIDIMANIKVDYEAVMQRHLDVINKEKGE